VGRCSSTKVRTKDGYGLSEQDISKKRTKGGVWGGGREEDGTGGGSIKEFRERKQKLINPIRMKQWLRVGLKGLDGGRDILQAGMWGGSKKWGGSSPNQRRGVCKGTRGGQGEKGDFGRGEEERIEACPDGGLYATSPKNNRKDERDRLKRENKGVHIKRKRKWLSRGHGGPWFGT